MYFLMHIAGFNKLKVLKQLSVDMTFNSFLKCEQLLPNNFLTIQKT